MEGPPEALPKVDTTPFTSWKRGATIYHEEGKRGATALLKFGKNGELHGLRNANLAHTVSNLDESWLWHYRFGHLPFKILNLLHKKSMVKGLPVIHEKSSTYEDCITGTYQRDSFPTSTT